MLMHHQDERLMQLNAGIRSCCWISDTNSIIEAPSKRRRSHYHNNHDNKPSTSISHANNKTQIRSPAKRSVHFSETSQVVVLPTRTPEDFRKCWYDKSELVKFKHSTKLRAASLHATRTAKLMKHVAYLAATANVDDDNNGDHHQAGVNNEANLQDKMEAIRGMEHLLCPTVAKLLMTRRRVRLVRVLQEQSRVHVGDECMTIEDLEQQRMMRIADVAMANSVFSKEWSRRIMGLHHRR